MDVANFFTKWLADMADTQALHGDGRIHSVVPGVKSIHHEGGPAWADAAVICPWTLYQCYGDTRNLEQCWPMMTRFMDFLRANSKSFIRADEHWKWKGYGDWLSIDAVTPPDYIGTVFYAYCAMLMAKVANVLGKEAEEDSYHSLFTDVANMFYARFVDSDGGLKVRTQTAYVLALHFDLLRESNRTAAVDALVRDIELRGSHLSTGFVGTPYLNHVLTRFGRAEVAYALLHQRTFPSWLYPVTQGATTMWERWDAWTHNKGFSDTGMNSFNHYAFGAVGAWLYSTVAGIDLDAARPGYKHTIIRPHPIGSGLTHVRAKLHSMYGQIESAWRVDGDIFHLEVTIPPNASATVWMPGENVTESGQPSERTVEIGAGRYAFESQLRNA
jgi:alpha-L-rhamnosidase